MPLYEYQCQQCGRRTEKIQKFSDAELTVCPHCSGRLERTLTAPAVHFAGGGWYKDLYSSAKPAAAGTGDGAKPASGSEGAATAGSSAGSDTASASTAAPAPTAPAPSAPATPAKT